MTFCLPTATPWPGDASGFQKLFQWVRETRRVMGRTAEQWVSKYVFVSLFFSFPHGCRYHCDTEGKGQTVSSIRMRKLELEKTMQTWVFSGCISKLFTFLRQQKIQKMLFAECPYHNFVFYPFFFIKFFWENWLFEKDYVCIITYVSQAFSYFDPLKDAHWPLKVHRKPETSEKRVSSHLLLKAPSLFENQIRNIQVLRNFKSNFLLRFTIS